MVLNTALKMINIRYNTWNNTNMYKKLLLLNETSSLDSYNSKIDWFQPYIAQ